MMTVLKIIIIVLLSVIVLIGLFIYLICHKFAFMVIRPDIADFDGIMAACERLGRFDRKYFDSIDKEYFTVKSRFGYDLHGLIEENEVSRRPENRTRIAVLCHGWTSRKESMSGYARALLKLGFTCVMYDHRNHGDNERCVPTTMGLLESQDLQTVIDYCYERYGSDIRLITYGESMGSAVVLSLYSIDSRPVLTVADCGYTTLRPLFVHLVEDFYHLPKILTKPIMALSNRMLQKHAGYSVDDVRPVDGVAKAASPILFCHGDSDMFIPCSMSEEMSKIGPGKRELYLCPGADHAVSEVTCPEEYYATVTDFINRNY